LIDSLRDSRQSRWDILISNPPYISPKQFDHLTARSVRNFEPKLALVPEATEEGLSDHVQGDLFYPRLLDIARELDVKVLLMEVGDLEQAKRVAKLAQGTGSWDSIEIWRDDPSASDEDEDQFQHIPIRGNGNGRSVFCWRTTASLDSDSVRYL
jgi:methylase of polypeptide subunit release factors